MHPKVSREDEESPVQPIDSSGSSSPSPVLTLFEGSHIHHGRGVFQSPPSNPLPNGLPLSAAQSRVGSPTCPAALPHHHFTLFNTRFALRKSFGSLADSGGGVEGFTLAASGFNCDSNGFIRGPVVKVEEDGNGVLLPEKKKKKNKGAPAKNLMAERRRRKKLNDKLLMLRSVVPNITKMDKTSILGDAIQYMEEMMQKINDLQNELEPLQSPATSQSTSLAASSVTHAASLPPAREKFPAIMKDLCPISLPSPNGQPARIEVRAKGRAMSIHMFCSNRPGRLLSITRALESVGLDIQNAVFSSFNGFVLDIYRAECKEGQDVEPEQIKALLLESIGFTTP